MAGVSSKEARSRLEKATGVRVTGIWPWQTVVVPPNVYVVHTRQGHEEPVNIGLGISFRFNPFRDSFLFIPATIQTLLINADGICAERQGILLQAYVQWIVDDIRVAYRRLDFSDPEDPMHFVNVQLREQAEAAMKDKLSTMRIDEVLADKRPIIEELTLRLREVSEGEKGSGGLGIKIVTVQIKETVVSSARVWNNLQRPFRAEQEKLARLAEIESERAIRIRELAEEKEAELARLEVEEEMSKARHGKDIERFNREQEEKVRRQELDHALERKRLEENVATEAVRLETEQQRQLQEIKLELERAQTKLKQLEELVKIEEAETRLERARIERQILKDNLEHKARYERRSLDLDNEGKEQSIQNDLSPERIQSQLVDRLSEIASKLPQPQELSQVQISGQGNDHFLTSLSGMIASIKAIAGQLNDSPVKPEEPEALG